MMKFYGHELELQKVRQLGELDGINVRAATDFCGGEWLIAQVGTDVERLVWVCAPVSTRALERVSGGQATVRDVLRHSLTGTVEVVTVDRGRSVPDRCFMCADLPSELLPHPTPVVATAA